MIPLHQTARTGLTGALIGFALACAPAHSQVIEIDSSGEARTYDGPSVFTDAGGDRIEADREPLQSAAAAAGLVAQTALAYGVDPKLLEAVAWQESRGRMSAVSVKGALGIMQLMPGTAAELGVDPRDPSDNVRGGAIYLRRQLDRFGSVPLALAAYNAGPGAVIRYGGIPPFRETRDYVSKILGRWTPAAARPAASIAAAAAPLPAISSVIEVSQ